MNDLCQDSPSSLPAKLNEILAQNGGLCRFQSRVKPTEKSGF